MLTPNLSLQYSVSHLQIQRLYIIADAGSNVYSGRYSKIPTEWILHDNTYLHVDEGNDSSTDYRFDQPDFNFGQFRSNLVIRSEYIPCSTVFLVWTREWTDAFYDANPDHEKYSFHFQEKAHNIFLKKFTYRFVL
jgi:hypothetical protein